MPAYILVDTDILIDVSRGVAEALAALPTRIATPVRVSVITQMELVVGCRNTAELRALARFLQQFAVLPVNEEISRSSGLADPLSIEPRTADC